MTDRFSGLLVTLDKDTREDDLEWVTNAIRMIRGVKAVEPVPAAVDQHITEVRRDGKWREALRKLLDTGPGAG